MTKIRIINIILVNCPNNENFNKDKNNKLKELIKLNQLLLNLFDNILNEDINDIDNQKNKILGYDIDKILTPFNQEITPQIIITKLEENQIYSNIKKGNKCFPFVLEFNIIIYHIHNLLEFKKEKEKSEIFFRNLFNCYILCNNKNDNQKFEINLFDSNCSISFSLEKDYISIKYKGSLFLSNYKNPREGINEFLFYLEFKDKSKFKYNIIKTIFFNIDI